MGMNCSFCACAPPAAASAARASKVFPNPLSMEPSFGVYSLFPLVIRRTAPANIAQSVRKRPEPELLLADLPQAREPERLDREEEHDQRAENDERQVRHQARGQREPEGVLDRVRREIEEDRQEHDEGSAQERPQDAAYPADDDHEEDAERQVELEPGGLDGPQVGERVQRAGDAAIERAD